MKEETGQNNIKHHGIDYMFVQGFIETKIGYKMCYYI